MDHCGMPRGPLVYHKADFIAVKEWNGKRILSRGFARIHTVGEF